MWVLAHGWEAEDEPPPSPAVVVHDNAQLRAALWAKAAGRPYYFTLRPYAADPSEPLREQIGLFLGGPWGGVSRSWWVPSGWSYLTARPVAEAAPAEVWFDDGSQGVGLDRNALLSAAEVIDAAVYLVERGAVSPALRWVGWDRPPPDGQGEPCEVPKGGRPAADAEPPSAADPARDVGSPDS